ncbi:hypothetical protein ACTWQB_16240 [Piscibacillus sp. B03]|uniref:hypothetical protein n=1 Tax=Piscibacillus sp. B03 TaxID=3457430 RepID=UPI003FCEB6A5
MDSIAGKILGLLAVAAIFTLVFTNVLWPAVQDKGNEVESEINSTEIGGHGGTN